MFETGFPYYMQKKVHKVLGYISTQTYNNVSNNCMNEFNNEEYRLLDDSIISFPNRIYFVDEEDLYNCLDGEEKLIYDCIFTRSCDGYVRQKHLKFIFTENCPEWCMPYVLKISSEYVEEIVIDIYDYMKPRDNSLFQAFCEHNPYIFLYAYNRMTSYWNEFYRNKYYRFHDYVGYKLYKECFGFSKKYYHYKKQ